MKAAEFDDRAEPFVDDLAKRRVAAGRIEIDVGVPTWMAVMSRAAMEGLDEKNA